MISQTESLDKIDIQILKALQEDARVTTKELERRSTCRLLLFLNA